MLIRGRGRTTLNPRPSDRLNRHPKADVPRSDLQSVAAMARIAPDLLVFFKTNEIQVSRIQSSRPYLPRSRAGFPLNWRLNTSLRNLHQNLNFYRDPLVFVSEPRIPAGLFLFQPKRRRVQLNRGFARTGFDSWRVTHTHGLLSLLDCPAPSAGASLFRT